MQESGNCSVSGVRTGEIRSSESTLLPWESSGKAAIQLSEYAGFTPECAIANDVETLLRSRRGDVQNVGPSIRPASCTYLLWLGSAEDEDHAFRLAVLHRVNGAYPLRRPAVRVIDPAGSKPSWRISVPRLSATTTNGVTTWTQAPRAATSRRSRARVPAPAMPSTGSMPKSR